MRHLMLLLMISLLPLGFVFAYSTGPPQGMSGNPPAMNNCTMCHNSFPVNSGSGTLNLIGMTEYVPGEGYSFAVELTDPDAHRWGFELIPQDADNNFVGTITLSEPARTQLNGNYIEHTFTGTDLGQTGSNQWSFNWIAPDESVGEVTFYFAGNAANGNGNNQGDHIYTNSFVMTEFVDAVTETLTTITPAFWMLAKVYPNPFNSRVTIELDAASSANTSVGIYDILGQLVATLQQGELAPGQYRLSWQPRSGTGTYFLRAVNDQGWSETRRLIYMK